MDEIFVESEVELFLYTQNLSRLRNNLLVGDQHQDCWWAALNCASRDQYKTWHFN